MMEQLKASGMGGAGFGGAEGDEGDEGEDDDEGVRSTLSHSLSLEPEVERESAALTICFHLSRSRVRSLPPSRRPKHLLLLPPLAPSPLPRLSHPLPLPFPALVSANPHAPSSSSSLSPSPLSLSSSIVGLAKSQSSAADLSGFALGSLLVVRGAQSERARARAGEEREERKWNGLGNTGSIRDLLLLAPPPRSSSAPPLTQSPP